MSTGRIEKRRQSRSIIKRNSCKRLEPWRRAPREGPSLRWWRNETVRGSWRLQYQRTPRQRLQRLRWPPKAIRCASPTITPSHISSWNARSLYLRNTWIDVLPGGRPHHLTSCEARVPKSTQKIRSLVRCAPLRFCKECCSFDTPGRPVEDLLRRGSLTELADLTMYASRSDLTTGGEGVGGCMAGQAAWPMNTTAQDRRSLRLARLDYKHRSAMCTLSIVQPI